MDNKFNVRKIKYRADNNIRDVYRKTLKMFTPVVSICSCVIELIGRPKAV